MKKALLLVSLVLLSKLGFCTFYTAVANGNFGSASTWSPAAVPTTGDFFTIPAGITVTVTTTESALLEGFAAYRNGAAYVCKRLAIGTGLEIPGRGAIRSVGGSTYIHFF